MHETEGYSFGAFVFEPRSGRLIKDGAPVRVQPKPIALLKCLLERRGKVVTRSEIQDALWPEGTHVDFDLGIKVAVRRLREALDDSWENPRYVQTVHGDGYRFVAEVKTIAIETGKPPDTKRLQRSWWPLVWLLAGCAMLVAILMGAKPASNSTPSDHSKWVIISQITNATGDRTLDGSLEFALERELSNSGSIRAAPRGRVTEWLDSMRLHPSTVITEDVAHRIAARERGVKAVLGGRVEKYGDRYHLNVRVSHTSPGHSSRVLSKQTNAQQMPEAIRAIATEVRDLLPH